VRTPIPSLEVAVHVIDARLVVRDSTLREGLDVPSVAFSLDQRLRLATLLADAGIAELEVLAPGRVTTDLPVAREIRARRLAARSTGLLYATSPHLEAHSREAAACLDHVDLLVPASPLRRPPGLDEKRQLLVAAAKVVGASFGSFGVGLPNATQVDSTTLLELARTAADVRASRITIYDTNGSGDPFGTFEIIGSLAREIEVPLFFHGHNDLGMATANTLAAVRAGARGIDVTVNGLGDRAGNCALEQIAVCLEREEVSTGIDLRRLPSLSEVVAAESGIGIGPLSPVTGAHVFTHKSPGHLEVPDLFEAYDPGLVGRRQKLDEGP
jgi:homocitrate synthase NifV